MHSIQNPHIKVTNTICMSQYWAQSLTPGNAVKVAKDAYSGLVITNACLTQISGAAPARICATITASDGATRTGIIATLVPALSEHTALEFWVHATESLSLEVQGTHSVDLIGYLIPAECEEDASDLREEEESY